ncbi:ATP synthase subunit delta', mitochondrial [Capsicum annuum]|nr:ATP synthase subunit delta', mitochondrial [Capsicum annuum]
MFRHSSRFLTRAATSTMRWRRPFSSTDLPAESVADSKFAEAWTKAIPNVDPPKTPSAFMTPRPPTPSSIPSKLTVNFVLPYSSELSANFLLGQRLRIRLTKSETNPALASVPVSCRDGFNGITAESEQHRSPIGARHRADRADITERVGKL